MENPRLDSLERGQGKFRSYLLGAVKHFLSDHRKRQAAAKRGNGIELESLDDDASLADPTTPAASDTIYDREWALAVVGRAIGQLETEQAASGKAGQFETLKPWLNGNDPRLSQKEVSATLGISEGGVKVAVHRLRKRFRELVRSEIAETVGNEDEITTELNYLIEALGQS